MDESEPAGLQWLNFLAWMPGVMFRGSQAPLIIWPIRSLQWSMVGPHHAVCFSAGATELVWIEGKINVTMYKSSWMKTCSRRVWKRQIVSSSKLCHSITLFIELFWPMSFPLRCEEWARKRAAVIPRDIVDVKRSYAHAQSGAGHCSNVAELACFPIICSVDGVAIEMPLAALLVLFNSARARTHTHMFTPQG